MILFSGSEAVSPIPFSLPLFLLQVYGFGGRVKRSPCVFYRVFGVQISLDRPVWVLQSGRYVWELIVVSCFVFAVLLVFAIHRVRPSCDTIVHTGAQARGTYGLFIRKKERKERSGSRGLFTRACYHPRAWYMTTILRAVRVYFDMIFVSVKFSLFILTNHPVRTMRSHPHRQTNPTNPVIAHPAPSCTSNRRTSLLFRIPSLKPVTNGTSAFAFQNPVMCMYAAETAARLANASNSVILGLKNVVTELRSESDIYVKSDFFFFLD